jgi:ATP-binding cassette subfamily F protein uup
VKAVRGDKPEKAPTTAPAPSTSGKKLSFKQKHALETLPTEIADLERKLQKAQTELAVADLYTQNPDRFNKLIKAQELLSEQKLKLEERWLELEMLREEMEG